MIPSFAVTTGFNDTLYGISMGGGSYFDFGMPDARNFDPIPGTAGSSNTTTGTEDSYLLPMRVGFYIAKPETQIEIFARHMRNTHDPWVSAGSQVGRGHTYYGSWGVGAQIGAALGTTNRFRLSLIGMVELMMQKATLSFTPTGGSEESIKIGANTVLAGGGLSGEVYLGDLWTLGLFSGFEHGFAAHWTVSEGGSFMGGTRSGTLNDENGDPISAKFGGFLIELSLRLAFYH
jgi:hypothetical protein